MEFKGETAVSEGRGNKKVEMKKRKGSKEIYEQKGCKNVEEEDLINGEAQGRKKRRN